MMDLYQKEVYDFLTKPDNFDSLVKAIGHYDELRKELLNRFWWLVREELEIKIKDTGWQIHLSPDITPKYAKLQLYKQGWKTPDDKFLFTLSWEGLSGRSYRGLLLYMDNPIMTSKGIKVEIMKIQKPEGFTSAGGTSSWWLWWNTANIDFNTPQSISKILPDKVTEVAREWAIDLYELAIKYEQALDEASSLKA